jgi:hypothetical protein
MRAAPPFQVTLHRFGVWRGAVTALAGSGLATIAAWLAAQQQPIGLPTLSAAILAVLAIVALGRSLLRTPTTHLRWDGLAWHLGPSTGEPVPGDLHVAIDLGPWMLLRFIPAAPAARRRTVWLPAQRRGLEGQWHALRCTVHSPRPAPADQAEL